MPLLSIAKELAIAALIGLLFGAAGAWAVQGWRIDAIKADATEKLAKAIKQEKDRADQISNDYAAVVGWLNKQKQARTVTVVKELEKPIYRDAACMLPESGRVLVNDAVHQANSARLGNAVLLKDSGTAESGNDGRSPSLVDMGGRSIRRLFGWQGGADQVGDGVEK